MWQSCNMVTYGRRYGRASWAAVSAKSLIRGGGDKYAHKWRSMIMISLGPSMEPTGSLQRNLRYFFRLISPFLKDTLPEPSKHYGTRFWSLWYFTKAQDNQMDPEMDPVTSRLTYQDWYVKTNKSKWVVKI